RQFGGSLGLTFIISFISRAEAASGDVNPANYLAGVKMAFLVAFLFAVAGLILSLFMRDKK
ncbi:MAG TPA: hypothetical protein VK078_01125, partial [Pseudogracilibacillus sp.]|nr:hypothetical protein [Pseudogracilibacillus sp.]